MKSRANARPQVWGHRGAMAYAPQNTLPSFQLAQDQGADGVELDVQLSRDGVLAVFHDARVDQLTDGTGALSSLSWKELRALDAGLRFGPDWKGTRIPTLEEVLAALDPRLLVNVELKTALSEEPWWDRWRALLTGPRVLSGARLRAARAEAAPLAQAVAKLLRSGPAPRFLVSSFDPLALEALAPLLPDVPLGFLHSPTVPWDTPSLVRGLTYQAWHPHASQVSPEGVDREHAAGRRVHVWTVNEPDRGLALANLGVDALITNRPDVLLRALGG